MALSITGDELRRKLGIPSYSPVYISRLYRLGSGLSKRIYIVLHCSLKGHPFSPYSWFSEITNSKTITGLHLRYGVPFDGLDLLRGNIQTYIARPIPIDQFVGDMTNSLVIPIDLAYYFRDKEVLKKLREEGEGGGVGAAAGGLEGGVGENVIDVVSPLVRSWRWRRGRGRRRKARGKGFPKAPR